MWDHWLTRPTASAPFFHHSVVTQTSGMGCYTGNADHTFERQGWALPFPALPLPPGRCISLRLCLPSTTPLLERPASHEEAP